MVEDLREYLLYQQHLYYNDQPEISDAEFDILEGILKANGGEPLPVGAPVGEWKGRIPEMPDWVRA